MNSDDNHKKEQGKDDIDGFVDNKFSTTKKRERSRFYQMFLKVYNETMKNENCKKIILSAKLPTNRIKTLSVIMSIYVIKKDVMLILNRQNYGLSISQFL